MGVRRAGRIRDDQPRTDLMLVCSPGGHLLQLVSLEGAWSGFTRTWVTLGRDDARTLLADENVVFAHGPTSRFQKRLAAQNLLRNFLLAWRLVGAVRPRVILTTGASVAVPFAWVGRVRGAKVAYVESFTRVDTPSLSCRLIAPIANRVYVQWPELAKRVRNAQYRGAIFTWPGPEA